MCERCYDDLDVDELRKNDEFKYLKTVDCYCKDICDQCFDEHARTCPNYIENKKQKKEEEEEEGSKLLLSPSPPKKNKRRKRKKVNTN